MKKAALLISIFLLALTLRLYNLGVNPASLYWDEVSLGYNSFLISTSMHDEHGEFLPVARFIAFGDYKPPGYIYATVPAIVLFGLSEFSVRFPSFIAGFLMVVVTYFLARKVFANEKIAYLSSFILAVSPWAIHFSRAAFEANLAAFFNLVGIYLFIFSVKKKWFILPSALFFVFAFYTFNANRIISPFLIIFLTLLFFKNNLENKKWFLISSLLGLFLVLPSLNYLKSRESKIRFQEVTIFNNLEPVETANKRIEIDKNTLFARAIHNRRVLFATDFLKHYFDNFSGRFLFTHGDINPRLSVQEMGHLYFWDLPFLLFGVYALFRNNKKKIIILFVGWMLISVIPAATARETPHALRILSILPSYQLIIAYGLYHFIVILTLKKRLKVLLLSLACFFFFANMFYYLHLYHLHFPQNWSGEWQYGYKEMVEFVLTHERNYDEIYVTKAYGRPYIYFAFYGKYPLEKFLSQKIARRDWFGFWEVENLGKIRFEGQYSSSSDKKILAVTKPENFPPDFRLIKIIKNLKEDEVFYIGDNL